MKYMLLIYSDPAAMPEMTEEEMHAQMSSWFTYTDALAQAGVLLGGDPLQDVDTATTVKVRNGERLVSDGPFAETREHLGGYYLLDCADLDEAIGWAARMPNIDWASVEVRPLMALPDPEGAS